MGGSGPMSWCLWKSAGAVCSELLSERTFLTLFDSDARSPNANRLMVRHWGNVLQNILADRKAFFANRSVRGIAGRRLQSNNVGSLVAERTAPFVDRKPT